MFGLCWAFLGLVAHVACTHSKLGFCGGTRRRRKCDLDKFHWTVTFTTQEPHTTSRSAHHQSFAVPQKDRLPSAAGRNQSPHFIPKAHQNSYATTGYSIAHDSDSLPQRHNTRLAMLNSTDCTQTNMTACRSTSSLVYIVTSSRQHLQRGHLRHASPHQPHHDLSSSAPETATEHTTLVPYQYQSPRVYNAGLGSPCVEHLAGLTHH